MRVWMRCAVAIGLIGLIVAGSAVAAETWMRRYELDGELYAGTVIQVEDGFHLIGTIVTSEEPPAAGIALLVLDGAGGLLHPIVYQWEGVRTAGDALLLEDGGLVFAGQTDDWTSGGIDMYILGVGPSRQTLWSGFYGTALDEHAVRIVPAPTGGFFVFGNQVDPDDVIADPSTAGYGGLEGRSAPYVARTGPEGQTEWHLSLRGAYNAVLFDGDATADGGCLLLSTVYGYPDADDGMRLMKLDAEGDFVSSSLWVDGSSQGYALLQTSDAGILIAGATTLSESGESGTLQGLVQRVDLEGNTLWRKTFGTDDTITALHAFAETEDGRFIVAGTRTASLTSYADAIYLLALDRNGDVLWEREHPTEEHVMVEAIELCTDGRIAIACSASDSGGPFRALLLLTDPEGRLGPPPDGS
jgi:hypothetical protein